MAIDATVSGVSANSYQTLNEAEAYFASRLNSDAWDNATSGNKEKALLTACRHIESLRLRSQRLLGLLGAVAPGGAPSGLMTRQMSLSDLDRVCLYNQALAFPRIRDVGPAGSGTYAIPVHVKEAQCEEAIALLEYGSEHSKRMQMQAGGVTGFSVDGLSETYGDATSRSPVISARARQLLARYVERGAYLATSLLPMGEDTPGSGR